jgi:hypothetical protein
MTIDILGTMNMNRIMLKAILTKTAISSLLPLNSMVIKSAVKAKPIIFIINILPP